MTCVSDSIRTMYINSLWIINWNITNIKIQLSACKLSFGLPLKICEYFLCWLQKDFKVNLWNPKTSVNSVFMKKDKTWSCKKGGFINQQKYTIHKTCHSLTSTWTHTRTYKPSVQKSRISNWKPGYLCGLLSWSLTIIKLNSILKQSVHSRKT
jgi:hypothetical protein